MRRSLHPAPGDTRCRVARRIARFEGVPSGSRLENLSWGNLGGPWAGPEPIPVKLQIFGAEWLNGHRKRRLS